ncbi:Citrate transporter [Desulfofarcimen acetoxidans DSM 771]|jgi:Na+/H+ antiporter NhaD/arsenite permease-like protein|uniref:Citrate transporter n=1 Tax=Desulfofarcimen acetoxidans (strain ATCC 49208 / DSM 771 / KCTC 5769 / VKM B-1644 / 5575) TaxID=485916 RepID=C8W4I4_DESAS|nr:ArsB/NhaD family transporter [Desulfofarcimen acetoxidans]ACV63870.1 Citrate transporter [Desulfofarcimen acetoxidans DSM 771]
MGEVIVLNDLAFWGSIVVFIITYAIIISEKIHRMVIAMAGGLVMVLLGFISQETAVKEDIDFNTLGLLIGMMILVAITRRTGVFEAIAVWAALLTKGKPLRLLALLSIITAFASAFLDNVTTVLLIVPVTITLTDKLQINPTPYLISEIIASNIGGTATLIGDPPNIMIGSIAGLSFNDFIIHLAPVAFLILLITIGLLLFIYRKDLQVDEKSRKALLKLNYKDEIKDWQLLKKSLWVLGLTIIGFSLHGVFHLESAVIALSGAILLIILSSEEPEDILLHVEWPTIFFFTGLFVLVGGLKATGVIGELASWSLAITDGNIMKTSLLILWVSAIASAFIDNIPFVATMIPMLQEMGRLSGLNLEPVWWSLALGACLGGNGTLIGASANVIVAGIAEKNGISLSFRQFMKISFPLMIISIIISNIYIYFRYF